VRIETRRTLIGLTLAGVIGAAAFPFAIYFIGLALAPPRPVPLQHTPLPMVLADAIWARASGGRATEFTPITPLSFSRLIACVAVEDFWDTTAGDARRVAACRKHLPAIEGVEYLAGVHVRNAGYSPSFRTGLSRFSTTVWLTHSWTRAEFLSTLAERAEFTMDVRGVNDAARMLFDRPASELDLPQATLIAAMIGDRRVDPWCDATAAANMRRRVLDRMREDGVIDEEAYQAANTSELGLAAPPAQHKRCAE
jgi:hypothetical protein